MLALIDGDVLCYRACKPRWVKNSRKLGGQAFFDLDDAGKPIPQQYTAEEDAEYLETCWKNFPKELDMLLGELWSTDYLMAVKSPTNFRDVLFDGYKDKRKLAASTGHQSNPVGRFVPSIRRLAVKAGYAIEAHDREADDYLRIWATEAERAGDPFTVCSIDKDLRCIPGQHLVMGRGQDKHRIIQVSQQEARELYYAQLLAGDPTDSIPGLPGVGLITAKKLLKGCETDAEFQEAVVAQYIAQYDDDWHHNMLINAKLIHLQRDLNDYFSLAEWPLAKSLLGWT